MQYLRDERVIGQPVRNLEGVSLQNLQPNRQRLQSAQGQAAIIGRDGEAQLLIDRSKPLKGVFVTRRHRAKQEVAVTAHVFRERLHTHIYTMCECVKHDTGRIGIIQGDGNATGMSRLNDSGHILHLHRDRAGAFAPNEAGIFADQPINPTTD